MAERQRRAPKLISIEHLARWAYAEQEAHKAGERRSFSLDSVERVRRGIVDGGSPMDAQHLLDRALVHPDATAVHRMVLRLNEVERQLVIFHAATQGRPDARERARHRFLPVGSRRWPTVERWERGFVCPVLEVDQPADVRRARYQYLIWQRALSRLLAMLQQSDVCLVAHSLNDHLPRPRPWVRPSGRRTAA